MYIGVDIIEIARVQVVSTRTPGFLSKIYTPGELAYCRSQADPYPSLAARFAAKEAVRKLDQAFRQGVSLREIEIDRDDSGQPYVVLHGRAAAALPTLHLSGVRVSLSHARQQAIAVALAY
jgi:holo-[acyl-carrier protein] synthase